MKSKLFGITALIAGLLVPVLPATTATAGIGVTSDASISYFVALNAEIEDFDSRDASDFETFNQRLDRTLSQDDAVARAKVRGNAFVNVGPDDSLESATAFATMDGDASHSENPDFVTVANPGASFSVGFSVGVDTPYAVNASMGASNNDSDDCSTVEVTLSDVFYRETHAGGDCGGFDPSSGSTSGVLPAGGYTLDVEADASMAGEDARARGSATYGVGIWVFPPCDLTGDGNANTLTGTGQDEVICAFGGNDTITGGGGNDVIIADDGDDVVNGGAGLDQIVGGTGDDEMHGGAGTDLILGGEGNDKLFGDDGSETSIANPPNAGLLGGPGNDELTGGRGADLLLGEDGGDDLFGSAGNDNLDGGVGADHLFGGADTDELKGGAANDRLTGDAGNDRLFGGAANDNLKGGVGADRMDGEGGDDELAGQGGGDTMNGDGGDDRLDGGGGRDDMRGQAGEDFFDAKDGERDELSGGPNRDRARKDGQDQASGIEVFL